VTANRSNRADKRIASGFLVGARGFEHPTRWSRNNNGIAILLSRLAWLCVKDHGFTPFSAIDPNFTQVSRAQSATPRSVLDPSNQVGTTGVGRFVRQATNGGELLVDGVSGQMARFQIQAIAQNDDRVEGQPRLGTVPGDELVDGVF
jgi:hypothetical protein